MMVMLGVLLGCNLNTGCILHHDILPDPSAPRELRKMPLPAYIIEPPDILAIDAASVVPKPPYKIAPLDILLIQVSGTLPNEPIAGPYGVEPEGTVKLGPSYGIVSVAGLTMEEARAALEKHLKQVAGLLNPKVVVGLAQFHGLQQIRGEHLVGPDGTINLGVYGQVRVVGLTIPEAKELIEEHLTQYLVKPDLSLLVTGYNSKLYYVIFDGAGYGQQVYRLPITGNDTVLDAISQLNGLPAVASLRKLWVARPIPGDAGHDQVMPVDWLAVASCASTATNYQLLPGDRLYVQSDRLIALDVALAKVFAPVERVLGVTLLGTETANAIATFGSTNSTGGVP
jgi:polysaccharide export outer membrane protein